MEFTLATFAAAAGAITLGAVLQAATGLGAGLVIVPLLGLISLTLIPGPLIFASLALSFLMAWRGRNDIQFFNMKILMAGLVLGMLAGALSLAWIPLGDAGVLFGVLVLLAVAVTAAGRSVRLTPPTLIAAGTLSGFMGTTAAIGAPVLALLYQHEEGKTLRATLGFLYFVSSILMLACLGVAGHFGAREAVLGLYLVPGFVLGYFLAAPLAKLLDRGRTRTAVLLLATLSAIVLIVKSG